MKSMKKLTALLLALVMALTLAACGGKGSSKTYPVVGKYIGLRDSYKSIYEALTHGAVASGVKPGQDLQRTLKLVGDAATGFLPTAGVGASNAIKSAQVLADELGRADASTVPLALSLWEERARAKVEANQAASRTLAKMMFVKGSTVAKARDLMLKHYPVDKVAKDIVKSNTEPW